MLGENTDVVNSHGETELGVAQAKAWVTRAQDKMMTKLSLEWGKEHSRMQAEGPEVGHTLYKGLFPHNQVSIA